MTLTQVLWMSFEEIKQDAEAAVRRVASFLKIEATEEAVRDTAQAVDFETAHVFGSGKSKKVEAMHLPHLAPWCNTAAVHLHLGAS